MDVTFYETQSYFQTPQSPLHGEKRREDEMLVAMVPFSIKGDKGRVVESRENNEEGGEKERERKN